MKNGKVTNAIVLASALANSVSPVLAHGGGGSSPSTGHALHGLIGLGIDMWNPVCAYACHRTLVKSPLSCSTMGDGHGGHDDDHDDDDHEHDEHEELEGHEHGHEHEDEHEDAHDDDHEHGHDDHGRKRTLFRRHGGHGSEEFETSGECYANDDVFLQSLAWCIDQKCFKHADHHDQPELWRVERFWETEVVTDGHHSPKYSYEKALSLCGEGPKGEVHPGDELEELSAVNDEAYSSMETYLKDFSRNEKQHTRYMLRIVFVMTALPLFLTFVSFLVQRLWPTGERMMVTHIVYPALWGKRHHVGLPYGLGIIPTRGQSLYLLFVIIFNLSLLRVTYEGTMPNDSYKDTSEAFWSYFSNRAGALAFANLVVIVIYSGRNNPLIWLTGWEHSTFLLLHRWVAYVTILEVALHAVVKLFSHMDVLWEQFSKAYWNVGFATAFIFTAVVPIMTLMPVRRRWYELFLDVHIISAVLGLAGAYYHIYLTFGHQWGYENWPLVAAMLWGAERMARLVRLGSGGLKTAVVRTVDHNHGEITIEGTSATGYVYLYFAQSRWRFWENHPFSVATSVVRANGQLNDMGLVKGEHHFDIASDAGTDFDDSNGDSSNSSSHGHELSETMEEKNTAADAPLLRSDQPPAQDDGMQDISTHISNAKNEKSSGISFLIRRQRGATRALLNSDSPRRVFVEGPYPSMSTRKSLLMTSPHVICIAGGSGITGVLPILRARSTSQVGRTSLYWSCHSEALVQASGVKTLGTAVQTHIKIESRWNIPHIVLRDAGEVYGDVAVVSCGPGSMADDVRWAVVQANRRKTSPGVVRLYEECFGW